MAHLTRQPDLLLELEGAIARGPRAWRPEALRRITDLFLARSHGCSSEQVAVFDEVMCRLEAEIELSARIELANRLARQSNAPPVLIRRLAFNDEIAVAGPVLSWSEVLDDAAILENAKTKSQLHLLAISRRTALPEAVTDVIVERGEFDVLQSALRNPGALFSNGGYGALIDRVEGRDDLIIQLGTRPNLPRHLFLKLLTRASETVRAKLENQNTAPREEVQFAVAKAVARMRRESEQPGRDYREAVRLVQEAEGSGALTSAWIEQAASKGCFEVVTAALASLCGLSLQAIEEALAQERPDPLLVIGKAAGLQWSAVRAILLMRSDGRGVPLEQQDQNFLIYGRISASTASRFVALRRAATPKGR